MAPEQPHPRFRAGDDILDGLYIVAHKSGQTNPPGPAEPVDTGGAGTVYRVKRLGFRDRALKVLTMPSRREDPQKGTVDYRSTFGKEQRLLNVLSHGNIVQLHIYGDNLEHENARWKYHVTEWVEGETLLQEMRSANTTGQQCYTFVSEVLQAIKYMHKLEVAHGDIKYDNIRCRHLSDKTPQAVLLDFGSAQLFGETAKDAAAFLGSDAMSTSPNDAAWDPDQRLAHSPFATTEKLLHPELNHYYNKLVTTNNCDIIFPFHDIFSVGVLFQDLLDEYVVRQKFEAELGAYGIRGMKLMIDRIKNSSLKDHHYKTIEHVHRDWQKLRPDYLAPAGVPELSVAAELRYSISTPMGRVAITPRLGHFTSHKLFGHINDIAQLEMLRPSLLSAAHTRAAHSALVLRNSQYYLLHLLNDPTFRLLVDRHEVEATLILALLHDIGHYQLSHLFEDYASEQKHLKSDPSRWAQLSAPAAHWKKVGFDIPSGDDLFAAAYNHLSPDGTTAKHGSENRWDYGEVIKRACQASPQGLKVEPQRTMGWLTERHFGRETYDAVIAIHESVYRRKENPPHSHIVLGGILSSDLGADQVSRLMLDSTETGVRYGLSIDLDGLLGTLRSPSPDDIKHANGPLLAISIRGNAAAESMLTARKLMHERIYWNPTSRAVMAMAKYSITRLLRAGEFHFQRFLEQTFFEPYSTALRSLHRQYDDQFEPQHASPIAYVLDGEQSAHQAISVFNTAENGNSIAEYLLGCTVFEVAALEDDLTSAAATACNLPVEPGDILLDVPVNDRGRPNGEGGGSVLVYEDETNRFGTPLETVTPISRVLFDTHLARSRTCRFYVSRRLLEALDDNRMRTLTAHVHEFLGSKASESKPTLRER